MVIQHLISGLTKFKFKHCLYYDGDKLKLSIGTRIRPYYALNTDPSNVLSGVKNVIPEYTYELGADKADLVYKSASSISKSDLNKLDELFKATYNFENEHHITGWKD